VPAAAPTTSSTKGGIESTRQLSNEHTSTSVVHDNEKANVGTEIRTSDGNVAKMEKTRESCVNDVAQPKLMVEQGWW
jgi:hypothetical protein